MMAKKLKALGKSGDMQLAEAVRISAQQVWQAGLGAFARALEEGGKGGTTLAMDGTALETLPRVVAKDMEAAAAEAVASVSKKSANALSVLEQVLEDCVARSLKSRGMPTRWELDLLNRRVEELSKAVAILSARLPTATPAHGSVVLEKTAMKTAPAPAKAPARRAARKSAT
jgi:poly(hydroxyalkanoate) granule-associated protein